MSLHIRAARSTDAGKLGDMMTEAARAAPYKPLLHSAAEDIAHIGDMIDRGWVRLCERGGRAAGFIARDRSAVQALYVRSDAQNGGIGAALLEDAKAVQDRLELWTFQANTGAQRFYLVHGFAEAERTQGEGNAERLPDIRYVWTRPAPKLASGPAKGEQA